MRVASFTFVIALSAAIGLPASYAQQPGLHMYEAAKADPVLAQEFQRIMQPVADAAPWVTTFGTTSPSTMETVDNRSYRVFHGCKPHDCTTENYTVLYDVDAKRIVAGAFLHTTYDGPSAIKTHIDWLNKPEYGLTVVLGKYLF